MAVESGFTPTGNVAIGASVSFVIAADDAQMGQETTCEAVFADEGLNFTLPLGTFDVDPAGTIAGTFAVPDPGASYYGPAHNLGVRVSNEINSFFLGGLHVKAPTSPRSRLSLGISIGL